MRSISFNRGTDFATSRNLDSFGEMGRKQKVHGTPKSQTTKHDAVNAHSDVTKPTAASGEGAKQL